MRWESATVVLMPASLGVYSSPSKHAGLLQLICARQNVFSLLVHLVPLGLFSQTYIQLTAAPYPVYCHRQATELVKTSMHSRTA